MPVLAPSSLSPAAPRHLILPFAACSAEAWLPTVQALPPGSQRHLSALLQGMALTHTDTQEAESLSPPHERALAQALGLSRPGAPDGLTPWAAQEAAQHLPASANSANKAWAWITPCHWAMGHMHATLSDPAALALSEDESRALLAVMQPYFETDGITLHYLPALGPQRWLAEGELFRRLPTAALDRVLARNVDAWLPEGLQARPLRRLQNEIQMLLYTHPFNDAREVKRQLPVNSFWISGTGDLPASRSGRTLTDAAQISAPRSLAQAVFKEDWAAYAQAWATLDADDIAQLLERQRAGETVRLTLCGERRAQTFESRRAGWVKRISAIFSPVRVVDVLRGL
ncbi:MAG: hypothetical protein NTZ64_10855 [Polaromonas sp.]|nr:hypothetical protein [Polaromonas sp.]